MEDNQREHIKIKGSFLELRSDIKYGVKISAEIFKTNERWYFALLFWCELIGGECQDITIGPWETKEIAVKEMERELAGKPLEAHLLHILASCIGGIENSIEDEEHKIEESKIELETFKVAIEKLKAQLARLKKSELILRTYKVL